MTAVTYFKAIVVFACITLPLRADRVWLEESLEQLTRARGPGAQIRVDVVATADDRAAAIIESNATTEIVLLYKASPLSPTPVEFRTAKPFPAVTKIPLWYPPVGFPSKFLIIDRTKVASDPELALVATLGDVLTNAGIACTKVYIFDDGFVALNGSSPGAIASRMEMYSATIKWVNASGASARYDITHFQYAGLSGTSELFGLIHSLPVSAGVLSIGIDTRLGLALCSTNDDLYYRPATTSAPWQKIPFATDADITQRINQCKAFVGTSHLERSPALPAQDITAIKAAATIDAPIALKYWQRHPRFYALSR